MNVDVVVAGENEYGVWDDLVDSTHDSTVFHKIDWLRAAEIHSGSKLIPLIGYWKGEAVGVFPIFFQKTYFIKSVFSPPPRCSIPYLGPLDVVGDVKNSKNEQIMNAFLGSCLDFIRGELNPDFTSIRTVLGLKDVRTFKQSGYTAEPVYTYLVNLKEHTDSIWKNFDSGLRRSIRKVESLGLGFREGSLDEALSVRRLMEERYSEQGLSYDVSEEYLRVLWERFGGEKIRVFVAEKDSIISGIIVTVFNGRASFWTGLPKLDYEGVVVNDWIHWNIIQWGVENKISTYDLIGAEVPRISRYKLKMNPVLEDYYRITRRNLLGWVAESFYNKFMR